MPPINPPQFHALTIEYNGLTNRIVSDLSLTQAFDPKDHPTLPFPLYKTTALWDTGATGCVVTKSTATAIGLVPIGTTSVNHAGGCSVSCQYLVNLFLPNNVSISGVIVTECPDNTGNFGAIIGMDIINRGDFAFTNINGKSCMSYRFPSIGKVDYVVEANLITVKNIGKNKPCPCGKKDAHGNPVKFKMCHGKDLKLR